MADDYDVIVERAARAGFVRVGEASHGTHEFYATHAEITAAARFQSNGHVADDGHFYAEQNARLVVVDGERYDRAMFRGGVTAWNMRDGHMADTLDALVDRLGAGTAGGRRRSCGAQLARRRRAGDRARAGGGVQRRPARPRAPRPRRHADRRLHDVHRHGHGGVRPTSTRASAQSMRSSTSTRTRARAARGTGAWETGEVPG